MKPKMHIKAMSRIKKSFALAISLTLVLSMSIPALAAAPNDSADYSDSVFGSEMVFEKTQELFSSIESNKELFGMDDVDFESIQIGEELSVYEVIDDCLVQSTSLHIFPIIANSDMVCLLYMLQDGNEWVIQVGKGLVNKINSFADESPFAIIYAEEGTFVYTGTGYHLIAESDCNQQTRLSAATEMFQTATRSPISELTNSEFSKVVCQNISDDITISAANEVSLERTLAEPGDYDVFCNVEKIQQPSGSWFCWACCIASMVNYMYDGNETYQSIAYLFNHYTDEGLSLSRVISEFNEWFDADYASTSSRNINQSFAYDELCNDRLIIGAYSYAGYGHAVVICGVNENFGSYAFMDPAVGDYCAGVIYNTSGDWSFVSESSGHRFTMQGYGYYAG